MLVVPSEEQCNLPPLRGPTWPSGDNPSLPSCSQSCLSIPLSSLKIHRHKAHKQKALLSPQHFQFLPLSTPDTLLHCSQPRNDHIIYHPNRDTLRVKKSTVNSYPRTTGVDWNCPDEADTWPPYSHHFAKTQSTGVALSVALDNWLFSSDWATPTILSLIWGLFLPVSVLPFANKGLLHCQKHWVIKDEGWCKMAPQGRKLRGQEGKSSLLN